MLRPTKRTQVFVLCFFFLLGRPCSYVDDANRQLLWHQGDKKRLNVCKCSKKTQQCLLSLLVSLKKLANNNSSPTLTFSFKKKPQKVGLRTNGKLFFSFYFLIYQKKKGLKRQIVLFFFCWTKTLWGLDQEQESKWFEEVEILFAFLLQATTKNFSFFAFSQLGNKKRRSAFLATSMNLLR